MKKIVILILSLVFMKTAYAGDNSAKLTVKLSGNVKNTYYLCVSNANCISIAASNNGMKFPITAGEVQYVFLANSADLRMYPQPLPDSCKVEVNNNHTLVITGKIVNADDNMIIDHLNCSLE